MYQGEAFHYYQCSDCQLLTANQPVSETVSLLLLPRICQLRELLNASTRTADRIEVGHAVEICWYVELRVVSVLETREPGPALLYTEKSREIRVSFSALTCAQHSTLSLTSSNSLLSCTVKNGAAMHRSHQYYKLQPSKAQRTEGGTATWLGAITIIYSE